MSWMGVWAIPCSSVITPRRSGWSVFGWVTLEQCWSHSESRAAASKTAACPRGQCWARDPGKHIESMGDLILRPIFTPPSAFSQALLEVSYATCQRVHIDLVLAYRSLSSTWLRKPLLSTTTDLLSAVHDQMPLISPPRGWAISIGSMGYSLKLTCSGEVMDKTCRISVMLCREFK